MAIGKRIRYIRNLRNLTQKELGLKIGFPERAADVRIAQYESETRVPKDDILNRIASALDVSPSTFKVPDIDTDIGLMHTLFALEDTRPFRISKIDDTICISLDKSQGLSYISMLDMLSLWYDEYEKLRNGEITKDEYDQWRYTYPAKQVERFKQDIDNLRKSKAESE